MNRRTSWPILLGYLILAALVLLLVPAHRGVSAPAAAPADNLVSVLPALPSPQPVGTTILWVALFEGDTEFVRYQFNVGRDSGDLRLVKDFSPDNFFRWSPLDEGQYVVQVVAENINTGDRWELMRLYEIRSRVFLGRATVNRTTHPLVLLYSAPACEGGQIRVAYRRQARLDWRYTPWQPCQAPLSSNFYVAGLREETTYELKHEIQYEASSTAGPVLSRSTGTAELDVPAISVLQPAGWRASRQERVLLQSVNGGVYERVYPLATDLSGNLIWYYRFRAYENQQSPWSIGAYLLRPLPGGHMLLFLNYEGKFDYIMREIDLVGNAVRETNVGEINRQLALLGHDTIGFFHHEALRLANGHTLILGSAERIVADVQGPGPVNIVGDLIIDLDENWRVSWVWNSFEQLDLTRAAVLGEVCTVVTVGCPPLSMGLKANDWTHANAIHYLPADGNLLLSLRNQDWIVKVDYQDGAGSGEVLWRLGEGGDFALTSSLADPWFSHQHDISFDGSKLALFDNGNTRCADGATGCNSRGQVYRLDEEARVATLELSVDLGGYSSAFGSAQKLANGNYHFMSGVLLPNVVSHSIEARPGGSTTFILETEGTQYRSYRMPDLYTPVAPPGSEVVPPVDVIFLPVIATE